MLGKKLLTLGCALGILAFGACFPMPVGRQGPPPSAPVPRPPFQIDLTGVQSIRVMVTNLSETRHLDPSILAQAVTDQINMRSNVTGVIAHSVWEAGERDADLRIVIRSENGTPSSQLASPSPDGTHKADNWSFAFKLSATLNRRDEKVIWSETDSSYAISHMFGPADQTAMWKNVATYDMAPRVLSRRLVNRMFHGSNETGSPAPLQ